MLTSDEMANVSSECTSLVCVRIYKVVMKGLNLLSPDSANNELHFPANPHIQISESRLIMAEVKTRGYLPVHHSRFLGK